jgi:SOS response associated peptidase (SRAP)
MVQNGNTQVAPKPHCNKASPGTSMSEMCGRFTLRTPLTVLAKQFSFDLDAALADVGARYNIAPTQSVLAVSCWPTVTTSGTPRAS